MIRMESAGFDVRVVDNYEQLSNVAAEIVVAQIQKKPHSVLGLATGSTPLGMYAQLGQYRKKGVDFSNVITFNLDEYVGLPSNHPQSYHYYMQKHLFDHVNIPSGNTHIPSGVADNIAAECQEYEDKIARCGGIDLQILGIGVNGHIGFNEPGTAMNETTRVVELAESTRQSNARFFSSIKEVPTQAISMGIHTIMHHSKHIVVLASGENKAEAIAQMLHNKPDTSLPASFLQRHSHVTVIVDREAAKHVSNL